MSVLQIRQIIFYGSLGLHFNNSCFIIGGWNGVSLSFYSETLKFSYWTNSYTKNEKRITSVVLFFISKTRSGG